MKNNKPAPTVALYASKETGIDLKTVVNYYAGQPTGGLSIPAQDVLTRCADNFRKRHIFELRN